jgi:SUKH-3 immunity protein
MSERSERFTPETERVLREAGWAPGRQVPEDQVRAWTEQLGDGFALSGPAAAALREFGGLDVDQSGPGETWARERFELDPALALGEDDRFQLYTDEYGMALFPLGEAYGSYYFLAIDPTGRTYLVMDDIKLIAESFDEALESLVHGRGELPLP